MVLKISRRPSLSMSAASRLIVLPAAAAARRRAGTRRGSTECPAAIRPRRDRLRMMGDLRLGRQQGSAHGTEQQRQPENSRPSHERAATVLVRIGGVAQAVANEVERQTVHDHEQPGINSQGCSATGAQLLGLPEQHAPAHYRWPQPQPEEAQSGLAEDHAGHRKGQVHDQVAQKRGQQVAGNGDGRRRARDRGRHHEVLFPELQQFAAHHAREPAPAHNREDNSDREVDLQGAPATWHRRRQRHPQRMVGIDCMNSIKR